MDCSKIFSGMKQQTAFLDELEKLIKHCKKEKLDTNIKPDDLTNLESYCENMKNACNTAVALAEEVKKADEAKKEKEKVKTQKALEEKSEEPAIEEDDDLSFLD